MLIQLLPDQVVSNWSTFREIIIESAPYRVPEELILSIQRAIIEERIQVWVLTDRENGRFKSQGIIMTTTMNEDIIQGTYLVIFAIYGFNATKEAWADALETLRKYARSKGYQAIVAYSSSQQAIKLAQRLGADTSTVFIVLEV